jgi:uncharacterized protein (DUF1697 family)
VTTWIALLRGINVGGNRRVPMAELRSALEAIGLRDVRTWIVSGNVVFRSARTDRAALVADIEAAIVVAAAAATRVRSIRPGIHPRTGGSAATHG